MIYKLNCIYYINIVSVCNRMTNHSGHSSSVNIVRNMEVITIPNLKVGQLVIKWMKELEIIVDKYNILNNRPVDSLVYLTLKKNKTKSLVCPFVLYWYQELDEHKEH